MNLALAPPRRALDRTATQGRFVMGLWGDRSNDRWRTKTLNDLKLGMRMARRLRALCYAVGPESHAAMARALRGRLPVTPLIGHAGNQWGNKLRIIRHALDVSPGGVVWLDCDAVQLRDLPEDFWPRLHAGAPLQTTIRQYHRRKCHWRHSHQRTLCGGAFIYCRDPKLIDRALEVMAENGQRGFDDEQAMAYVIDELEGGWRGLEHYHAKYNPPWYTIRGAIFPPENPVFTAS